MTQEEINEGNKFLAIYMGFIKVFPNMTSTSELSKEYRYPYIDRVFPETVYVSNVKRSCTMGREVYEIQDVGTGRHYNKMMFNRSMDWLYPVYQKINKFINSVEFEEIHSKDVCTSMLLQESFHEAMYAMMDGKDVSEIFEKIVEWIIIYNLKIVGNA